MRRIGVAGAGAWGLQLIRNFHRLGVLAAVCEPLESRRATVAELVSGVALYVPFDALLADPLIQAVAIATPAATHFELCRRALLAGKDVFCEKPLALSYAEALELKRLSQARGLVLMVGHLLEYHPAIHVLRRLVSAGELGALRYLYSHRLNLGRVRREENVLWSFAPHDIAVILRLLDNCLPDHLSTGGNGYLQPEVADLVMTRMTFPGGAAAHVFVSWLNPFKEQRLVVAGTRQTAVFDDVAKSLTLYEQRFELQAGEPVMVQASGQPLAFAADEPLLLECRAFLAALASRQPPLTDADSALRVIRVLQTAEQSLRSGGQVLPLCPEAIPEDKLEPAGN